MKNYEEICREMCDVARKAGAYIAHQRLHFSRGMIEVKGSQNFVSYVDKGAEQIIIEGLEKVLPGCGFITEEEGARDAGQTYKWIVDPLDGTTNFIHGAPPYCVSIALYDSGTKETVAGVVFEVTMDECFYAWKDSAAYMNGREISVSPVDKLCDALVAVGFAYDIEDKLDALMAQMKHFLIHTNGVRRIGAAAAVLAYVACGRFDAFAQIRLAPWDVAAGAFIVRRAGGVVTDFSGGGDYVFGGRIVAATPPLYDEFKKIAADGQI